MFVRFRLAPSGLLNVGLAENRRVNGRVQQQHVAHLGGIPSRLLDVGQSLHIEDWELHSLRARVTFWDQANERLGRLANRLGPDLKRLRIAVHRRVPWPMTPERERLAALETHQEGKRWFGLYEFNTMQIARIDAQIAAANHEKSEYLAEAQRALAQARLWSERGADQ